MADVGKKCIKLYKLNIYTNLNGEFKNCCYQTSDSYQKFKNIDDIKDSPLIKEIQAHMEQGKEHPSCEHCYKYERQGIKSPREIENENYTRLSGEAFPNKAINIPKELYIRFSNLCNFACRMCNGNASTGRRKLDMLLLDQDIGLREVPKDVIDKFYDINVLKELDTLDIKGGEPFLHSQHFDFINYLIESNLSKQITLKYNSNLSILPGVDNDMQELLPKKYPDILTMWEEFKQVKVLVSLEGYGKDNDYVRLNANWSKIENNIDILQSKEYIDVLFSSTIQIDNLLSLPKLILFAQEKDIFLIIGSNTYVKTPKYYDIRILPQSVKVYIKKFYEKCKEKYDFNIEYSKNLDDIVKYMYSGDYNHDLFKEYLRVTQTIDSEYKTGNNDFTMYALTQKLANLSK